ncbi:MAG: DUF3572 domain-containing protein [Pseudomonadota bacterium]
MLKERAETMALTALGWLAGHDDLMPVFLGSTGASLDDLRARASEPEFLGSVLDFILMDDAWVVELCDAQGWEYTDLAAARAALPGGEQVNWT